MERGRLAFAVEGGDRRQEWLCRLLRADGHGAVLVGSFEEPQVLAELPEDGILVAPRLPEGVRAACAAQGRRWVAYQDDPACVLRHAVITAENAIQVALAALEQTLQDRRILVVGAGRIGRALAAMLRGMGCAAALSARRPEDLAGIRAAGHEALDTGALEGALGRFDLIFNTVPARVLGEGRLKLLPPDALIIDLASKPGGVDFEAARARGLEAVHALALPGKLKPQSAAAAIRDAVYRALSLPEREE